MKLKELVEIAAKRMSEHGLVGWTFRLANAKRRLGVCKHPQKRIEIAAYYARNNTAESVLDTLMHEIEHAIAGPAAGHGPEWKAVAARLGATPRACDNSPDTVVQPGDWQTTCPACHKTHFRYRRPPTATTYRCRCPARSSLVFTFRRKDIPEAPSFAPQRTANWQAACSACGTIHRRLRRPKAGQWRCGCPHHSELTWSSVVVEQVEIARETSS